MTLLVFLITGNYQFYLTARDLSFQLTRNRAAAIAEELALKMDLLAQKRSRSLSLLSNLWREAPKNNQRHAFLKWARELVISDRIFDFILYIDTGTIMMVTPPAQPKPLAGIDIQSRPAKEDLYKTLRKSIAPLDAPPTARVTSKGSLVFWFPVMVRGQDAGTMAGALNLKDLLSKALTPIIQNQFWIRVRVGGNTVLDTGAMALDKRDENLKGEKELSFAGLDWQVAVWPKGGGAFYKLKTSDSMRLLTMVALSVFVSGFLGVSLHTLNRIQWVQRSRMRLEKRYQTLFDSAIDGILVIDLNGQIFDANQALCSALGYEVSNLTRLTLSDILGEKSKNEVAGILYRLQRQEKVFCEVTHQTREGWEIPVEMGARSFEYMGNPAVLIMSRDISQRKLAMKALAESEARLKAIFDQAGVGIMQCGQDYCIQHANDKLCQILGYSSEELAGMNYWDYSFTQDRAETDNRVKEMKQNGLRTGTWKKRLRHKSGKVIWVRMTTSLIWSRTGKYLYSIDVVEDITKQHRLEGQLRQAQKMESIGILAGGIAHDFNNILGSILGFTQMAILDAPADSKARQRLDQVFKAANLAKDLVRQILTFSRRSEDTPHAIRISPIIKETLKFLKALLPANIHIEHDFKDADGRVMGDPTQIHQVLMNLCTNGAQAMSPGGGTLKVSLYRESLDRDDAREKDVAPGDHMVIRVSDTGKGIDPNIQDRIFEPYYTTKDAGEGTGMGLAVVHGVIREYEGRVLVESVPEKGSDFIVYLPQVEPGGLGCEKNRPGLAQGNEHLLFIDDNASLSIAAKEMIEYLGYTVELFSDPQKALDRVVSGPKNIQGVITDYAMPGMNGDLLAKKILKMNPDIPVILCTGNSRNLNFEQLLHSGIRSILIKPLILEELAPALKAALAKKE